jgi:hypothetical protein
MMSFVEALYPDHSGINLHFAFPLRAGLELEEVLAGIRDLIQRHEALRTLYIQSPSGPAQRVLQSGELAVPVLVAPAGATDEYAAGIAKELAARPFLLASELPIRVTVIVAEGQASHVAFALSHLSVDFDGARWIHYHLRALARRPHAEVRAPAAVHRPVHQAAWEKSDAGQRTSERALRYHEQTFRAAPQSMLPRTAQEIQSPRFRYLQFDSPALAIVVPELARRHRVSLTAVLYAGISLVAGYVSSLPRTMLQLTVGNRIEVRTRYAVGMFTQDVLAYVDISDASIGDVIERAGTSVMKAARFGRYSPSALNAIRSRTELDRGIALDLSCWLNYRLPGAEAMAAAVTPTAGLLAEQRQRTAWRWNGSDPTSTSTYFIYADHADGQLRLTMLLDTTVLPPEEGVSWLRSVESLLCAAALGDVAVADAGQHTDLRPLAYGADWALADYSWVHLPTVASLVGRLAKARHAEVFAIAAHGSTQLIAYLAGPETIDLERLHADCVAELPGLRTAMAPHRYVLCDQSPAVSELAAWQRLPVLADGCGRPAGHLGSNS